MNHTSGKEVGYGGGEDINVWQDIGHFRREIVKVILVALGNIGVRNRGWSIQEEVRVLEGTN
jgi:hypothetical protein